MKPATPQNRRAWLVCGLLLLASAINYMDRQTLANASVRITREFSLNQGKGLSDGLHEICRGNAFRMVFIPEILQVSQ